MTDEQPDEQVPRRFRRWAVNIQGTVWIKNEPRVCTVFDIPPGGARVLGPAPCTMLRLRDRCRWHLVVQAADEPVQRAAVFRLARFARRARGADLTIDVDPTDMS